MKYTIKLIGIIAIATIIGLVLITCDDTKPCTHTWGEWTVTTEPTCVATGTGTRTCTACGEADANKTIPVDSNNHNLVIKSATATCTEGGDVTWECDRSGCNYENEEKNRPALGHNFINYTVIKAANCIEAGSEEATCERNGCNETNEKEISKNDHHDWEMLAGTPSTCTIQGKGKQKCNLCNKEEDGDHLPLDPYNHTFNQWQETMFPTCTTAAIDTEKCSGCSVLGTVTKTGRGIDLTAHNFNQWQETTPPTCTTAAIDTVICSECSTLSTVTRTGNAAIGHNRNWTVYDSSNGKVPCTNNGCNSEFAAIGDTGPASGIIFYVSTEGFIMTDNNSTAHYLEAALVDIGRFTWASSKFIETYINGTETEIGTGRKNTAVILVEDSTAPAATACYNYDNNNKNDWFLPSKDELEKLYYNRTIVGNFQTSSWYLSSSSIQENWGNRNNNVWAYVFDDDRTINTNSKTLALFVRPIRAF